MSITMAAQNAKSSELRAVVIRCGCGHPDNHPSRTCPRPRAVEDRGTVAFWHRNPLRRAWGQFKVMVNAWRWQQ